MHRSMWPLYNHAFASNTCAGHLVFVCFRLWCRSQMLRSLVGCGVKAQHSGDDLKRISIALTGAGFNVFEDLAHANITLVHMGQLDGRQRGLVKAIVAHATAKFSLQMASLEQNHGA